MPAQPVRYSRPDPAEPVIHDLPPLVWGGESVPLRVEIRRDSDGMWRGRLHFGADDGVVSTAEILCAPAEPDLWQAIQRLSAYHLRDLYRSVTE